MPALNHLLEASFDPVMVHVDGRLVQCNAAYAALLGYDDPQALVGILAKDIVVPAALPVVVKHAGCGSPDVYETVLRRRDGTLIDVEVRGRSWDEDGRHVRMATCRDITEKKRRAALLAAYGGEMVEQSPDAIMRFDRACRYVYVNPTVGRNTGRAPESFTGRTMGECGVSPERVDFWTGHLEAVFASGAERVVEFDAVDPQGRLRYHQAVLVPEASGEAVLVVVRDITSLKRTELELLAAHQRLREVDRYKDEFLSIVSHELRTPLNFIMGFASVLEDELHGPLNEQQRQDVARVLDGADRMLGLVDDMLDFARLQAGTLELGLRPTDPLALPSQVVQEFAARAAERGVTLACQLAAGPQQVVDAERVRQALAQLVGNAIKFSEPGGQVTVRSRLEPGGWILEVKDEGCGIEPDHLAGLFERFKQVDMSYTRRKGGMGLGLAIARALVEAHGGRIEAESAPGRGSTFRLVLPVASVPLTC